LQPTLKGTAAEFFHYPSPASIAYLCNCWVNLNIAKKSHYTDMGEPVGKGSGRTLNRMSTYVPDPSGSSAWMISFHSLKISNQPPSEALKSGLLMAVYP
jgi:hypothetical protein